MSRNIDHLASRIPQHSPTRLGARAMIETEQLTDAERKMWAYVLLQALTDLSGRDPFARSARLWFSSRDDSVGSLIWICNHLSLEPDAVRQRVLRGTGRKLRESIGNLAEATTQAA
jgi:hypothetical protein